MKDKKKLLLVINDPLEFNLLMNKFFVPLLLKKYNITLKCPVNKNRIFRQSILEKYPSIKFLESNIDNKLCLLDRINFWLRKELFFLLNAGKSESCFQKVFLNLDYLCRIFIKKSVMKNFNEFFSFLFNNSILRSLLKIFIVPLIFIAKLLQGYIFSYKTFFTKIYKDKNIFDSILWAQPYSLGNINDYCKFANYKTKLISVCRNFDTPALKGIFTVPVDYTIVFDKFLYEHIENLNNPLNYGKLILKKSPIRCFRRNVTKKRKSIINILYATGAPRFIPDEHLIIMLIYNFFVNQYKENFRFFIRLHRNDNIDRYDSNFLKKRNIFLEKEPYSYCFNNVGGEKEFFPIISDIDRFYHHLQEMDLVLSCTSTINYEAHMIGVKTAYIRLNQKRDWLYNRDHLKILNKKLKIPIIDNLTDLKKYNCLP